MECRRVQQLLWVDEADPPALAHVEACPSCRREARRLGELRLALVELGEREVDVPEWLEGAILTAIARTPFDRARDLVLHPRFWRSAAVGAAAAAAAFGLIVARRYGRPDLAA